MQIGPGYAFGQLERALATARGHDDVDVRARAGAKVARWVRVLEGMAAGTIEVGSRTPVAGAPAWATLEVAHGGFATGALLAGGPLREHERALADRIRAGTSSRVELNAWHLGDEGRRELEARLRDGRYRIDVPEEGALLTVAWLMGAGQVQGAEAVLDAIVPLFDRLRFYPVPIDQAPVTTGLVHRGTAAQTMAALRARAPQAQVVKMNEAITVWVPLHDRIIELLLETVEGALPTLARSPDGSLARGPNRQPIVCGGWPCRRWPDGWHHRARALREAIDAARTRHPECGRASHRRSSLAQAIASLERIAAAGEHPSPAEASRARTLIAGFVSRHGAPSTPEHRRVRAAQARVGAMPRHDRLARVLAERLGRLPADSAVPDVDPLVEPVTADEAPRHCVPAGAIFPAPLARRLDRCLEASMEELVQRGVVTSAEVVAELLPQLSAGIRATGLADDAARRLYAAIYAAFRRRRSLLLLNLEHQVTLEELPWVAELAASRTARGDARIEARRALEQVVLLCFDAFPYALVPNKLLTELRALADAANVDVPLVDELAADIFMGAFTTKFVRAAKIAGRALEGTLYACYYDMPIRTVLELDDAEQRDGHAAKSSAGFAALCRARAAAPTGPGSWVAANGTVIEQQQILTTQNLAPLVECLGLRAQLAARMPRICDRIFDWACRRQAEHTPDRHARLIAMKNGAYAWRQLIYFASSVDAAEQAAWLARAQARLARSPLRARVALEPALRGLEHVMAGGRFDEAGNAANGGRRWLGWVV